MSDLESVAFSSDGLHLKAFHYLILNTDTVFLEFFDLAFSDSISLQVKFEEGSKSSFSFLIGSGHGDQWADVLNLIVFQKEKVEVLKAVQRDEIIDLITIQGQGTQPFELTDPLNRGDAINAQVERGQLGKPKNGVDIFNLVVAQIKSRHVLQPSQWAKILHLVVG